MPLWVPLAILFAIGIFAFVIPSWVTAIAKLGQLSGISESWAGFAGAIIAAVMVIVSTFATAVGAWFAIQSQNRIAILTREEERIEREFPGLIEARDFFGTLVILLDKDTNAKYALDALKMLKFPETGSNFLSVVEEKLPDSSDALRRRLARILGAIWASAISGRVGEGRLAEVLKSDTPQKQGTLNEGIAGAYNMLSTYIGYLHAMSREVHDRVEVLEARRMTCRTEIERFFDS